MCAQPRALPDPSARPMRGFIATCGCYRLKTADEPVRPHGAMPLQVHSAMFLEPECMAQAPEDGFGSERASGLCMPLYTTGNIHGVAEKLVMETAVADDARVDRPGVQADANVHGFHGGYAFLHRGERRERKTRARFNVSFERRRRTGDR